MTATPKPDYEVLSPYLLLRKLADLAMNSVPPEIAEVGAAAQIPAWIHLEDGVAFFFRQILMLDTHQLGKESRFEKEPEGIVLVDNVPDPFALMYECKARGDSYSLSADDVRRYKDYIKTKKYQIRVRHRLELTHFVIVTSEFSGEYEAKVADIECQGIVVSLCPAEELTKYYDMLRYKDIPELRQVDIRAFFKTGLIPCDHCNKCVT